MITFRASGAGYCIRQIVTAVLNPALTQPEEKVMPFLNMGHHFQAGVEQFLKSQAIGVHEAEKEVSWDASSGEWGWRGHVDGVLRPKELLEVKAVTRDRWEKLRDGKSWREMYPQYMGQATVYAAAAHAKLVRFLFINRDSSVMIGGIEKLDHPAYIFDESYIFRPTKKYFNQICVKHELAAELIQEGVVPEECDFPGWCFYCQAWGSKAPKKSMGRVYSIDDSEDAFDVCLRFRELNQKKKEVEAELKDAKDLVSQQLDTYEADGFTVEAGDDVFTINRTLIQMARADSAEVRAAIDRGEIHKSDSSYYKVSISQKR